MNQQNAQVVYKSIKDSLITQEWLKNRRASDRPSSPDQKNKWTHGIDCLNREVEEQKAQIEDFKVEVNKRAQTHKVAIADI